MAADPVALAADEDSLAPRRNPALVGHDQAERLLVAASESGRLPHAILLGGPRGIGKATLAYRFARWLLARPSGEEAGGWFGAPPPPPVDLRLDPAHPVARRVAANAHADLLTVERAWDPKRKRLRAEIVIEDVRAIAQFLHLTPAEGGWRVVIVDGADEMNRNAANALLKMLEEPPRRALLLLVCHAPGRLLPTIRSRCRKLYLQPLAAGEVDQLLRQHQPDLGEADRLALARLAGGSIGRALDLVAAGGLDLYRDLIHLLEGLPQLDPRGLHGFAERVARGGEEGEGWDLFTELLTDFIARLVGGGAEGQPRAVIDGGEAALLSRLAERGRLDHWIELWDNLRSLFGRADSVNLDRKQVALEALFRLEAAAR